MTTVMLSAKSEAIVTGWKRQVRGDSYRDVKIDTIRQHMHKSRHPLPDLLKDLSHRKSLLTESLEQALYNAQITPTKINADRLQDFITEEDKYITHLLKLDSALHHLHNYYSLLAKGKLSDNGLAAVDAFSAAFSDVDHSDKSVTSRYGYLRSHNIVLQGAVERGDSSAVAKLLARCIYTVPGYSQCSGRTVQAQSINDRNWWKKSMDDFLAF